MITYIYSLSDSTGIRYIGKSDNPQERLKKHLRECSRKRTKKEKWLLSLRLRNELPILEILDEVSDDIWSDSEVYWISQCKAWGFSLLNGTSGGEGSDGFRGKKHTEETKKKCSDAVLSRPTKTSLKGESNGRSILNDELVREIKSRTDSSLRKMAAQYGVSKTTIIGIRKGDYWKHVD